MPTYRRIGDVDVQTRHRLTCHCRSVVLELELPDGVENPRRCNCSMCSKRGAVSSSIPVSQLHVLKGKEHIALYQFNTMVAEHYFCRVCGIYTHHRRRSDPSVYGYNVACLDGVDVFALGEVPTSDGRNHVCDRTSASEA
jgi:hypothetical protein